MRRPIITLLTDFGLQDHYVAAVKGVMLGICPDATLVDITHEINSWNVAAAAYELARTWQYFPAGTVHLVVVDPGVGSARRPLLVSAAGHHFVAPDNGVLSMAVEAAPGQAVAREITAAKYFRSPVSRTFHGRDIFGPVAAHLAGGHLPEEFGPAISDIARLPLSAPARTAEGVWDGSVLRIDRFGNVVTNFPWSDFHWVSSRPFLLKLGTRTVERYCTNYSEVMRGELCVLRGSADLLEVSSNQCHAGGLAQVSEASPVRLYAL